MFGSSAIREDAPQAGVVPGVMVDSDGIRWMTAAHWSSLSPRKRSEQAVPTMAGLVVRTSKKNGGGKGKSST